MRILIKILTFVLTILFILTILALIDYFGSLALAQGAWTAFWIINLIQSMINVIALFIKIVISIPLYIIQLTATTITTNSFADDLTTMGKNFTTMGVSLLALFLNALFSLGHFIFNFLKMIFNLIPWVDIPSNAEVITVGMIIGMKESVSTVPDWLKWAESLWRKVYDFVYNLPLISSSLVNVFGEKIQQMFVDLKITLASKIFWVDILGLKQMPAWTNNLYDALLAAPYRRVDPKNYLDKYWYEYLGLEYDPYNIQWISGDPDLDPGVTS